MAKFKFPKKVFVELLVEDRAIEYDDNSIVGESIAYILDGREVWKDLVLTLYEDDTDANQAEFIINKLHNALADTLYFQKIFTK
jgi:hypothetical protein